MVGSALMPYTKATSWFDSTIVFTGRPENCSQAVSDACEVDGLAGHTATATAVKLGGTHVGDVVVEVKVRVDGSHDEGDVQWHLALVGERAQAGNLLTQWQV